MKPAGGRGFFARLTRKRPLHSIPVQMDQENTVRHCLLVAACLLFIFTRTTPLGAQQDEKQARRALTIAVQDRVLHSIDPRLFGQFMERPSWGGAIGVEAALTPGTSQLQPQAERSIREMQIPLLRFPGGTDVDHLDWTDMIDNVPGREGGRRPVSTPRGNRVTNRFGYDEFLRLCERNGSDAILVLNFRDGLLRIRTLEDAAARAAALVAYCNATLEQELPPSLAVWPKLRARNGHPEPYRVKYFQIGNETWFFTGEVGKVAPEDSHGHWINSLRSYIKAIQAVDPAARLIVDTSPLPVAAATHKEFGEAIAAFAVHRYRPWGISQVQKDGRAVEVSQLTAREIWNAWVAVPAVDDAGQAVFHDRHFAQAREMGYEMALTEWNWNGWWLIDGVKPALDSQFAKGIGAASFLHAIMRQGDLIKMATQSMLIGSRWGITAIRVDREARTPAFMMPSGMVTMLYSQHHGKDMVALELSGLEHYEQPYKMGSLGPSSQVAFVDVIATKDKTKLTVHMINRSFDRTRSTTIDCTDFQLKSQQAKLLILQGRLNNQPGDNEPLAPAHIQHRTKPFTGRKLQLELSPRSVTFAEFSLLQEN